MRTYLVVARPHIVPSVLPRYGQSGGNPDADLSDRVGHSFSGMIVTDVGVDPKVTAMVYVAARAPDAARTMRRALPSIIANRRLSRSNVFANGLPK